MTFRLAGKADQPQVRAMIVEAFAPISWMRRADREFGPFNGLDWRERFGRRVDPFFERGIVLLGVTADGAIAAVSTGSVDIASGLGSIEFLAVDPQRQGQGFGREMLRGMLDHFRSLGATTATLECLTSNEPAMSLYRAEGWTEIASSVRFFKRLDGILGE